MPLLQLATQPDATVAFLREQLRPVKEEPERITQLIGDLASEKFAVCERVSQELEY